MGVFTAGGALAIGLTVLAAGVLKLLRPLPAQHAIFRLLPDRWQRPKVAAAATAATGFVEVAVGGGLLGISWWPRPMALAIAGAGAALCTGFVAVVAVAIRKGEACGCWTSFSDGPAGRFELGRAVGMAVAGWLVLIASAADESGPRWTWVTAVAAFAIWAWIIIASLAGAALGRNTRRVKAAPLSLAPHPLGFLFGQVTSKAGTVPFAPTLGASAESGSSTATRPRALRRSGRVGP